LGKLKTKAIKSIQWSFFQQITNQIIGLVVTLFLVRLLDPDAFGLMGMIYVIISLGTVIIDSGLGTSLIRTKAIDEADVSTVFFSNLILSSLFYLIIFFIAPLVSEFYNQEILIKLIRVLGLTLIINSFYLIQNVTLTKGLMFKKIALVSILSNSLSAIVGIWLAYLNFGVWSIVIMNICNSMCSFLLYWNISKWRPKFIFNTKKISVHFNFGYRLTIVNLLDAFFVNIYNIILGKYYNANLLGFYTRADSLKKTIIFGVSTPLKTVLLPVLSEIQNDSERLRKIYTDILQLVLLVISPILLFSFVFATPIFHLLFTNKWDQAIPFFKIICLSGILYPINTYVVSFLLVKGRSDLVLTLDLFKKLTLIIVIVVTMMFENIIILLWGQVIVSFIDFLFNIFVLKKILRLKILYQLKTTIKNLFISGASSFFIFIIYIVFLEQLQNNFILISLGLICFLIFNCAFIYLFNPLIFKTIWGYLKS
jgi:teichuronic acid exporter